MPSISLETDKSHQLKVKTVDPLKIYCEIDVEDNQEEQVGILTLTQNINGKLHKEQKIKLKNARKYEDGWVEITASGVKKEGELTLTLKYIAEAKVNQSEYQEASDEVEEEFTIFENIPYDEFIKFGSDSE